MKHQLKIKLAGPEDNKNLVEWLNSTKGNLYDPDILSYPTLRTLCSYNSVPVAYMPTQRALMLESLAVNPTADLTERAQAFRDLVKAGELLASSDRIREIYMVCEDENVVRIAQSHGFTVLPWPVLRMKVL